MLELTTTRHNPLIDPHLAVWSWEIPVYLFLGGIVAGMMVLAGINLIRVARGDDPKSFFSVQTPIFAMALLSLGMLALFLDLAHKLYVWRVYLAFEPTSPMSWGSWVLILVYPVLAASALLRLPDSWPGLARAFPSSDGPPTGCSRVPASFECWDGRMSCWVSRSASTRAFCSTRWLRGRYGTARYSARCSCFRGCLRAPR